MRIIGPMLIMLVSGLSLGVGGATLFWSAQVDRGHHRTQQVFAIADDWKRIAETNQQGWNECLALIKTRF